MLKSSALLLASVLVLAPGCGARSAQSGRRADRNTITADQIRQNGYRNAYEAVEGLRAPWLVTRPDGLEPQRLVQVYLDNSRLGGTDMLRQIPASDIALIRYIDAATAINRWGVDHGQGVIMVLTKR